MSNPPRRSRPKKPGATIDLKAMPAVGYPGPVSPAAEGDEASGTALDAEARVTDTASEAPVLSAPAAPGDDASAAAVPESERTGPEGFAQDESLSGAPGRPRGDLDDTILSAAVPDFVAGDDADTPTGPPPPSVDYSQTTPPPTERGGGIGSAFAGAVLGAVLALGGAAGLQYAGYLPAFGPDDRAEELAQFARSGDVQQVSTDLGTLRNEVEQLRSAQAAGGTGGGVSSAELTTVADRVTALEQRGDQGAATGAVNQEAAENARATAERAAQAAEAARQAADGAGRTAGEAKAAADQSRQTAEQSRQVADTANQAAMAAQQAASTAQQAASGAQTAANSANETIAAFETRLAAIETANRAAGTALSAAALKAAIDRGGPFMSELEGFATAAGTTPAVETLRGFAAEGVPSPQALAAQWPDVEGRIAEAIRPPPVEGDVGNQILSGLGALITSRPSGTAPATGAPTPGEGPSAVLGRLSAAIASGDLEAFLPAWETLPQAAKDASADFKSKVEARVRTDSVVGETLNSAVNASATRS